MVFADLPGSRRDRKRGRRLRRGGVRKAASDIYAPVSGEIVAAKRCAERPELVNSEPYAGG